jgi:hypothetical protein
MGGMGHMKVELEIDKPVSLGNRGVLLKITGNDGRHMGDLRVGRATVEWMKGRTREGNGKKIHMNKLVEFLDALD